MISDLDLKQAREIYDRKLSSFNRNFNKIQDQYRENLIRNEKDYQRAVKKLEMEKSINKQKSQKILVDRYRNLIDNTIKEYEPYQALPKMKFQNMPVFDQHVIKGYQYYDILERYDFALLDYYDAIYSEITDRNGIKVREASYNIPNVISSLFTGWPLLVPSRFHINSLLTWMLDYPEYFKYNHLDIDKYRNDYHKYSFNEILNDFSKMFKMENEQGKSVLDPIVVKNDYALPEIRYEVNKKEIKKLFTKTLTNLEVLINDLKPKVVIHKETDSVREAMKLIHKNSQSVLTSMFSDDKIEVSDELQKLIEEYENTHEV